MKHFALIFVCLWSFNAWSQSTFVPLNEDYYHWVDRYEIKTGKVIPEIFTSVKQYRRSAVVAFADSVNELNVFTSRTDQFNYQYLRNDSWEWSHAETNDSRRPVLKHFYRKKSDLYPVEEPAFDLHVNPVLYLGAGKDSRREDMLFINAKGVEIRGMIDKKVGFYTYFADNQELLPSYVYDQMTLNPVVPHEGFWKDYKNGKAVDFLQARGYITFDATKHIHIQFGQDRTFIGNGYRSLIFSDQAPPSLFLKTNVKIWKLNYLFMLSKMTADVAGSATGGISATPVGYPDKFMAFHHLSVNIGKKLNIGLFESVIFSTRDSVNNNRGFQLGYLNPIIFYRALEQQDGSSDNVLLGGDFKWNAIRNISLYGQVVLDEFVIQHIKAGDGWWANKFALQGGIKYIDAFGVPNLDLQGEINVVRPYTYSHDTQFGNYSNYRQPIAHPLGANFKEMVGILRYQPFGRLNIVGKLIMATVGRDTTGVDWGSDILKNNTQHINEFGNTVAQGISNTLTYGSFTASWQLKHNLFIDVNFIIRQSKSAVALYNNNTSISSVALRWNISRRLYEF